MKCDPINAEQIDQLLRFLPLFDAPNARFVERWAEGRQADGTNIFPFPVYSPQVREFFRFAARPCWTDHQYKPDAACVLLDNDTAIERANVSDIRSMLTYCVRGERFCDGHWEAMLRSGRITKLLRRLQELRDVGE